MLTKHGFFEGLSLSWEYTNYELDECSGSIIFPVAGYSKSIDGVTVQPYIQAAYTDKSLGKACHASLQRDFANGWDPYAIKVHYNGHYIGWVPKTISQRVVEYFPYVGLASIVQVKKYASGYCQAFLKLEYNLPKDKALTSRGKIEEEEKKEQNPVVDSFLADMLNAIMED